MTTTATLTSKNLPAAPWWRFGMVWMVIAGPAIVVVAGFVTLYLAIANPEEIVTVQINPNADAAQQNALAPAMQARNHAQTGVPLPKTQP